MDGARGGRGMHWCDTWLPRLIPPEPAGLALLLCFTDYAPRLREATATWLKRESEIAAPRVNPGFSGPEVSAPFRFSGVLSGKPVYINTKIPCFQHYIQFFGVLITVIGFLRVITVYNLAVRCTRLKYLSSNKYKQ